LLFIRKKEIPFYTQKRNICQQAKGKKRMKAISSRGTHGCAETGEGGAVNFERSPISG
jgi:hypothetical protein